MGNEHSSPKTSSTPPGEDGGEVTVDHPVRLSDVDENDLREACEATGDAEVVSRLISKYPALNINQVELDEDCRVPVYSACQQGFKEVARVLLDAYPKDVDKKNPKYHKTPLSACILKRTTQNPLHSASSSAHYNFSPPEEIIDMLVNKYNADVNRTDKSQHTALHWAASVGYKEAVQILLDCGRADVSAKNWEGRTPYDLAVKAGYTEVAKILKDYMSREAIQTYS